MVVYFKQNAVTVDGARLTEVRVAAGMSQQQLAEHLGCNKSQVSRWERGELVPSEERILKMIALFGRGDFVVRNDGGAK